MNLVTGASGFIGGRIVHALCERDEEVAILTRPDADLKGISGLRYRRFTGDVLDRASVYRASKGCRRVFHAAALYRLWSKSPQQFYRVNVEGTRNVIRAAMDANVEKIVYTSSVATIGIPEGGCGTEETPCLLTEMIGDYKKSKYLAEAVARDLVREGAPVVIVNPTYPVGFGDVKPTPTGQVVIDFLKRKIPAYVETGLNVVDVDDVAVGHILAADKGRIGRRYILGNSNLTLKQILVILASITGLPQPAMRLPYYPVLGLAYCEAVWARLAQREPRIPLDGVRMARKKMFVDISRALSELQLPQTPPAEALRKSVQWFREYGYA